MDLGIFAKTYAAPDVASLFEKISLDGLQCVHYNMVCSGLSDLPMEIPPASLEEINRATGKNNISIKGLSATFNMIHPDLEERIKGLRSFEGLAAAAGKIGTNFLSLCTGTRYAANKWQWHPENASREAYRDLLSVMEEVLLIAEKYDLFLGVEPETANVVKDPRSARRFLDDLQSRRLKIILDPANLFEKADDPGQIRNLIAEALELLHPELAMAHAKDRSLQGTIRPPGKGDIDFECFIGQLKNAGFAGPLIIHGLAEKEVPASAKFLRSILG